MRKHLGILLIWITLVAVAAVDIAVNGWHIISFSSNALETSLGTSAASAARLARIPTGREFTASIDAAEVHRLVIDNPAGSVVVHGAEDDAIRLRAWLIIYTDDAVEGRRALERAQFTVGMDGGVARPGFDPSPSEHLTADSLWDVLWEVSVPHHLDVDIVNRDGPVSVHRLSGTLHITNERGRIEASEITGKIHVVLHDGELEVSHIDGEIAVQANESELNLNEIAGSIAIDVADSAVTGSSLHGDVRFDASSGRIDLYQFSGDFALSSIDTTVFARTALNVETFHADITGQSAVFEIDPLGSIGAMDVRARSSHVTLWVPHNVLDHTVAVHATRGAKLVSDWDFAWTAEGGGALYRTVFGDGTHPFDVAAIAGSRVNLGVVQRRPGTGLIEQHILVP